MAEIVGTQVSDADLFRCLVESGPAKDSAADRAAASDCGEHQVGGRFPFYLFGEVGSQEARDRDVPAFVGLRGDPMILGIILADGASATAIGVCERHRCRCLHCARHGRVHQPSTNVLTCDCERGLKCVVAVTLVVDNDPRSPKATRGKREPRGY
jgi:hypothetical protein